METATISTRVKRETLKKLEKLAAATNRTKAYLTAEAIEAYVNLQSWQIEAIKEGVREADKENFATESETKRFLKKWGISGG